MDKEKELDLFSMAKSDALRLLSARPRSLDELKKRLETKKYPADVVAHTLELLKSQGLLDDKRFAKLVASSSISAKPVGRSEVVRKLKAKGVDASTISETLQGLEDYDEKKAAKEAVSLKFSKMTGISKEKKKSRIFGFLKRRGFASDTIFKVMDELFQGVNQDDLG